MKPRYKFWLLALALLLLAGLAWLAGAWRPAVVKIGVVPFTSVNERVIEGFKKTLARHGWEEGKNVEYRTLPADGDAGALESRVRELLAWKPALVLAASTPASQVVYRLTKASRTPMVFAPVSDPLAAGIVKTLAQPGEHATGVQLAASNGLRLMWLHRIAPKARAYYVPYSSDDVSALVTLKQIEADAKTLGLRLILRPVAGSSEDIERAAQQIPADADAIFLTQDGRIGAKVDLYIKAAEVRRIALSAPSVLHFEKGALMTYGFDHLAIGHQAGRLGAEILKGQDPGRLPVETADNHLFINLRAAGQIGLMVEDDVLRQAKKIIR
jgi:putative ABC transport system substrate-binding protein